jgi:hypothetical protein
MRPVHNKADALLVGPGGFFVSPAPPACYTGGTTCASSIDADIESKALHTLSKPAVTK